MVPKFGILLATSVDFVVLPKSRRGISDFIMPPLLWGKIVPAIYTPSKEIPANAATAA